MTKLPSLCLVFLLPAAILAQDLTVKRVVDGDTLLLSNRERVRLIGIDAPEVHESEKLNRDAERTHRDARAIQELGAQSARFVQKLMTGRPIRMEYDQNNRVHGHKDKYDRTLAYVYFDPPPCDELEASVAEAVCELPSFEKGFLNALVVEAGYAKAYTSFPFEHRDDFLRLQKEAREEKRGLWKKSSPLTDAEVRTRLASTIR